MRKAEYPTLAYRRVLTPPPLTHRALATVGANLAIAVFLFVFMTMTIYFSNSFLALLISVLHFANHRLIYFNWAEFLLF